MTVSDILKSSASLYPEKTAFTGRNGSSCSFGRIYSSARTIGTQLIESGLAGCPGAIMGEVDMDTIAAIFGCAFAGCPLVVMDCSRTETELCNQIDKFSIGALFCGEKHRAQAENVKARRPKLLLYSGEERVIHPTKILEADDFAPVDPESPAFLFFDGDGESVVMLSHKNICSSVRSVAEYMSIGSYTFLSPAVWGDAFDCVIGILLPLWAGCSVVQRGEKRSVARAVAESGATAVASNPARIRSLERSLKLRSEKQRGKAEKVLSDICTRLLRFMGDSAKKKMYHHVHSLMGDNLKLIICGGKCPMPEDTKQFAEWGFEVCSCYFDTACGALAMSSAAGKPLTPIADITIASPAKNGAGEIVALGDRIPIGYFEGKTEFGDGFPTGDMGIIDGEGKLQVLGRKRTMLYDKDANMIFPEAISAVLKRSRYIADCSVSGRFDTKDGGIFISVSIIPDQREVSGELGQKYSDNRQRLFFNRVMNRLAPELPHKINEFRLPPAEL